jgi:hypothetical protein
VLALVLVVVLGGAVLTGSALARRWRVAPPLLQVRAVAPPD